MFCNELLSDCIFEIWSTVYNNPKIMIVNVRPGDHDDIKEKNNQMFNNDNNDNDLHIVSHMTELVPEFVPQNPKYTCYAFLKN